MESSRRFYGRRPSVTELSGALDHVIALTGDDGRPWTLSTEGDVLFRPVTGSASPLRDIGKSVARRAVAAEDPWVARCLLEEESS